MHPVVSASAIALGALALACPPAFAQTFLATPLPIEAMDLNNKGEVVGYYSPPGYGNLAALWKDGVLTPIGANPPGGSSGARAINDEGVIAGWFGRHPAVWIQGVMVNGPLTGPTYSSAHAINNKNQVLGRSFFRAGEGGMSVDTYTGFLWQNNTYTSYDNAPAQEPAGPVAINDQGTIVGNVARGEGASMEWDGVVYVDGSPQKLQPGLSRITNINNRGEILGHDPVYTSWGSVWRNGATTILDAPAGYWGASGAEINDRGQVAGSCLNVNVGQIRAFLFDEEGPKALESITRGRTGVLYKATRINDRGQMLVLGEEAYYLLTPVYGDANGDFAVNLSDAVAVLRAVSGLQPLRCMWICDMAPSPSPYPGGFGDGHVDVCDVVCLLRTIAAG